MITLFMFIYYRAQAPTNDAVYRALKSNQTLIGAQKNRLKDLEEKLKQLKLYNKTITWNTPSNATEEYVNHNCLVVG